MGVPDDSGPESSAARVALWRALHMKVDAAPHVFEDDVGLQLIAPTDGWQHRPDMNPEATRGFRAAIVARARFIEDLVADEVARGNGQYVVLGAGLDTFAQRRPELGEGLTVFEVDEPGPQAWKRRRLVELGRGVPDWLRFVPVDFEHDGDWVGRLSAAGFATDQPCVVASTGLTMYLTIDAIRELLLQLAALAPGSTVAMTFLLPVDLLDEADRSVLQATDQAARASGTPFLSYFSPDAMVAMAREAGFQTIHHVSGRTITERYFSGRADGLRPSSGEDFLVATT